MQATGSLKDESFNKKTARADGFDAGNRSRSASFSGWGYTVVA
jgi:hypothetical protein